MKLATNALIMWVRRIEKVFKVRDQRSTLLLGLNLWKFCERDISSVVREILMILHTNIYHASEKNWEVFDDLGSGSLGIHLRHLTWRSFSTTVSVSVQVQMSECHVAETYIFTSSLTGLQISGWVRPVWPWTLWSITIRRHWVERVKLPVIFVAGNLPVTGKHLTYPEFNLCLR